MFEMIAAMVPVFPLTASVDVALPNSIVYWPTAMSHARCEICFIPSFDSKSLLLPLSPENERHQRATGRETPERAQDGRLRAHLQWKW